MPYGGIPPCTILAKKILFPMVRFFAHLSPVSHYYASSCSPVADSPRIPRRAVPMPQQRLQAVLDCQWHWRQSACLMLSQVGPSYIKQSIYYILQKASHTGG